MPTLAEKIAARCERADFDQGWFAALSHDTGPGTPWSPELAGLEQAIARRSVMPQAWQRGWASYTTDAVFTRTSIGWEGPDPVLVAEHIRAKLRLGFLRKRDDVEPEAMAAAQAAYDQLLAMSGRRIEESS